MGLRSGEHAGHWPLHQTSFLEPKYFQCFTCVISCVGRGIQSLIQPSGPSRVARDSSVSKTFSKLVFMCDLAQAKRADLCLCLLVLQFFQCSSGPFRISSPKVLRFFRIYHFTCRFVSIVVSGPKVLKSLGALQL